MLHLTPLRPSRDRAGPSPRGDHPDGPFGHSGGGGGGLSAPNTAHHRLSAASLSLAGRLGGDGPSASSFSPGARACGAAGLGPCGVDEHACRGDQDCACACSCCCTAIAAAAIQAAAAPLIIPSKVAFGTLALASPTSPPPRPMPHQAPADHYRHRHVRAHTGPAQGLLLCPLHPPPHPPRAPPPRFHFRNPGPAAPPGLLQFPAAGPGRGLPPRPLRQRRRRYEPGVGAGQQPHCRSRGRQQRRRRAAAGGRRRCAGGAHEPPTGRPGPQHGAVGRRAAAAHGLLKAGEQRARPGTPPPPSLRRRMGWGAGRWEGGLHPPALFYDASRAGRGCRPAGWYSPLDVPPVGLCGGLAAGTSASLAVLATPPLTTTRSPFRAICRPAAVPARAMQSGVFGRSSAMPALGMAIGEDQEFQLGGLGPGSPTTSEAQMRVRRASVDGNWRGTGGRRRCSVTPEAPDLPAPICARSVVQTHKRPLLYRPFTSYCTCAWSRAARPSACRDLARAPAQADMSFLSLRAASGLMPSEQQQALQQRPAAAALAAAACGAGAPAAITLEPSWPSGSSLGSVTDCLLTVALHNSSSHYFRWVASVHVRGGGGGGAGSSAIRCVMNCWLW